MFNPYPSLFGNFPNRTFADIFPSTEVFVGEYTDSELYTEGNKIENPEVLYALLYARYGNSVIASFDENQFKYKVFATIFMYGPTWEKRLKIQKEIRDLNTEDGSLLEGVKYISNLSMNPSTKPNNGDLTPLETINQQTYNGWKKNKLQAYQEILEILKTDVTESFIGQFKKLFITVVEPNLPLWYETNIKEDPTL